MQKIILKFIVTAFLLSVFSTQAAVCPDPINSSLQQGIIPYPWQLNPFSENKPRADEATQFVRANILVVNYGRGVVCTYKNSAGSYSIWWQTGVKLPAAIENNWHETLGGYECINTFDACIFYT